MAKRQREWSMQASEFQELQAFLKTRAQGSEGSMWDEAGTVGRLDHTLALKATTKR